ncbi:helix-turn-helix domain-containing protein [Leucobacter sp. wl10]|nr:helix-turn-helix domain-containing protein [Leucobacter sp. wl10]
MRRHAEFGSVELELRSIPAGRRIVVHAKTDTLQLYIVRQGAMEIMHLARRTELTSGGAAFVAANSYGLRTGVTGTAYLRIDFPRELSHGTIASSDDAPSVYPVPSSSLLLRPVAAFATRLVPERRGAAAPGISAYYAERLLQEMLQGLLVSIGQALAVPRPPETFALARSVISAQCSDARFTAADVAREVNLSLRQLERVFQRHRTSIGREIRDARIEQAVTLLSDPAHDALSVDQIARFVGFSTGSSLARAMTASKNISPSQVRAGRNHRSTASPSHPATGPPHGPSRVSGRGSREERTLRETALHCRASRSVFLPVPRPRARRPCRRADHPPPSFRPAMATALDDRATR